ncbi:bactofilin family protein [Achromobacter deleyi]|uniref:bactofilin family protein n=1 Tax=Achromobacter deleyi TaxID=1353891 RepID=UPI001491A5D2|nr:polymer-forming cytoskeletal protein [Achromobacter deleyi]QVQ27408.1 polymer-forming cytoskeletal protein [Achromobacter deleyi]UIP23003.1 polymer-forming cytoskeletal protein [Achromobacter deleyi]
MLKKARKRTFEITGLSSLIFGNVAIKGDVSFSGGVRVDGRIEGDVTGVPNEKNLIVVSEKGSIVGRVCVYDAIVNGTITGDLVVEHFLELQVNARVTGNIVYRQLQMECGAVVDGKLERVDDVQERDPEAADLIAVG